MEKKPSTPKEQSLALKCNIPSASPSAGFARSGPVPLFEASDENIPSVPHTAEAEFRNRYKGYINEFCPILYGDSLSEVEEEDYNHHCLAAPLVQVFSVRLHTQFNDNKQPCSIYGRITVTEAEGGKATVFTLYERENNDPEVISKNGAFLSLTGPVFGESRSLGVVSRSKGATMQLSLKDSVRDVEVLSGGKLNFGSMIEDDMCDKLQTAVLKGEHGVATVYYATVLYGVMASIKLKFVNDEYYGRFPPSDVHLIVTAHYGNTKLYQTKHDYSKHLEILLLKKPLHEFMQADADDAGSFTLLCRHAVVVPGYSSLIVEANLHSPSGKSFCGSVEFSAMLGGEYIHNIRVLSGHVRVEVILTDVYSRVSHETSVWGSLVPTVFMPPIRGEDSMVEVFSIRVCGKNHDIHSVCGTVVVNSGGRNQYIFQIDERTTSPKSLLLSDGDDTLPLSGPEEIDTSDEYTLKTNLKDPKQGLQLSRGGLAWCSSTMSHSSWYDKRLCSVIQGKDGYAVVHHIVFFDAVLSMVEAKLCCNGGADVAANVHGSLVVRYGNHEYRTWYENKYFKTTIFSCNKKHSVLVPIGANIPLSRSLLMAPRFSSLIVEVDLKATANGSKGNLFPEDHIRGEAEFLNCLDPASHNIVGANNCYFIQLLVKWDLGCLGSGFTKS